MSQMTIADFKRVCETLGRFASVRETAKEPQDRIVVQASNGLMKLIAGDEDSTVVVELPGRQPQKSGKSVVSSRLLLTAAKSLRGKGTVDLAVTPDGATVSVSGGGRVRLSSITNELPDFLRVPRELPNRNTHPGLDMVAALLPGVSLKGSWDDVYMVGRGSDMYLVASDGRQYVEYAMAGPWDGEAYLQGRFPATKLAGLKGFSEPGTIEWNADAVVFRSGPNVAVMRLTRNPEWFPPRPKLPVGDCVAAWVDRRSLINAIQGLKPNDEHARVVLAAKGGALTATDWNTTGTVELPTGKLDVAGHGRTAFDGDRMRRLLTALPGKDVCLTWAMGSDPSSIELTTKEAPNCLTLLAPVL